MRLPILLVLAAPSLVHADAAVIVDGSIDGVTVARTFPGIAGPSGIAQTTPDPGGGAGVAQLVDVANGSVVIREASGLAVRTSTADAFWTAAGIAGTPHAFGQRARYDIATARWFVSAEQDAGGAPNQIYLAVSSSSDATGPWKAVTLPAQGGVVANTQLGIDGSGVYVTGDLAGHGIVLALPIADVVWTGSAAPSAAHLAALATTTPGLAPAPDVGDWVSHAGPQPAVFLARDVAANGHTAIDVYALVWQGNAASLAAAAAVDLGAAFPQPSPTVAQPSPGGNLAIGGGAIASAAYDSESGRIVAIATTEIGARVAAFWFELDATYSLVQVGTIADPAVNIVTPAIAVIGDAIAVVFVAVSANVTPEIMVTGRRGGDPPGALRTFAAARYGQAPYSCAPVAGVSTFGRYASISLDPQSSTVPAFWAVAQYGATGGDCAFGTSWAYFTVDPPIDTGYDLGDYGDDTYPVDHPPQQDPIFHGCGCSSRGDMSSVLVLAAIVSACAGRRARRRRP